MSSVAVDALFYKVVDRPPPTVDRPGSDSCLKSVITKHLSAFTGQACICMCTHGCVADTVNQNAEGQRKTVSAT